MSRHLRFLQPFGVDLFCTGKKFLVFNMVGRNLKIKYRRSLLGVFWTLLTPLAMSAVFYFIFKIVMRAQMPHYLAFILSGILPWSFFSATVLEGLESFVGNWGLVSKVPVPLQVFPFVGSVTNLVTLALAIPILIGVAIFNGVVLGPSIVMVVYYYLSLFLISYGIALVLAVLFVHFRDLRHILGIVMQLWFYATPVVYDETAVPDKYRILLLANPLTPIFRGIHAIFVNGVWPDSRNLIECAVWTLGIVLFSAWFFKVSRQGIVEHI